MSIVITGNPGVGKHTVAERIAKELEYTILDLNKIAIEYRIFEKNGTTLDVNVQKLARIIKKIMTKDTLVVGHLAPYVVDRSQIKLAVILRKNPYKLISIYKKRKYSKKKQIENAGSEILGVIAHDSIKGFGLRKTCQLDTSNLTVNQTVNKVKLILKKKFAGNNVDWLALVAKRKEFEKFFPN